eukprot:855340-Amphidinium_carterae.2
MGGPPRDSAKPCQGLTDDVEAAARDDALREDMLLKHLMYRHTGEMGTLNLRRASHLGVSRYRGWAKGVNGRTFHGIGRMRLLAEEASTFTFAIRLRGWIIGWSSRGVGSQLGRATRIERSCAVDRRMKKQIECSPHFMVALNV